MRNVSLPNIFLASKSFSQYYLADIFSPCIVPHKPMQFFCTQYHTLTRAYVYMRVITANYVFCCHKCHTSRHFWWKILPNLDYKRAQSRKNDKKKDQKRRRKKGREHTSPQKQKESCEEIRTKKRKAVKGFLVVCVVRNRLLRQQVNKV